MDDEPRIASREPVKADLESGRTYWWCVCGRSGSQPFCDGSHAGTCFEPLAFTVDRDRKAALCQCKRTKTPPYCDGSHAELCPEPPRSPAG